MRDTALASRYAVALFSVTEKRGETVRALEDMKGLAQVLAPNSAAERHLMGPQMRMQDKRDALRSSLQGRVAPTVVVFIDLLLRKKRLRDFETIVSEFEGLVEKAQGIQRAQVVSAVPLTADETAKLLTVLENYTKKKVKLTADVEAELLGGALVRIGDRVVDRSVRTLLEAIEHQLLSVSV